MLVMTKIRKSYFNRLLVVAFSIGIALSGCSLSQQEIQQTQVATEATSIALRTNAAHKHLLQKRLDQPPLLTSFLFDRCKDLYEEFDI